MLEIFLGQAFLGGRELTLALPKLERQELLMTVLQIKLFVHIWTLPLLITPVIIEFALFQELP